MTTQTVPRRPRHVVAARGGLWREVGGVYALQLLDVPPVTPGMVVVGRKGEDWRTHPELRFQVWPDDLEPIQT